MCRRSLPLRSGSPRHRKEGMGAQQQQQEGDEGGVVKRRKVLAAAAAADVTMDLDVLDCPVCFHPLRPPVFQCTVGHTICSSCHEKLPDKCPFCSLPTAYNRCHKVEHVIESIKVACSNVNHGCTARVTYYQKEDHEKGCQHALCFCPENGCSFSGPTKKLLEHVSRKHKWNSGNISYKMDVEVRIQVGSAIMVGEDGHMFLVKMILDPFGAVVLVCCIQPYTTGSKFKCRLTLSCTEPSYSQSTEFLARSTNLKDGLPKDWFPFLVPKALLRSNGTRTTTAVGMVLTPQ